MQKAHTSIGSLALTILGSSARLRRNTVQHDLLSLRTFTTLSIRLGDCCEEARNRDTNDSNAALNLTDPRHHVEGLPNFQHRPESERFGEGDAVAKSIFHEGSKRQISESHGLEISRLRLDEDVLSSLVTVPFQRIRLMLEHEDATEARDRLLAAVLEDQERLPWLLRLVKDLKEHGFEWPLLYAKCMQSLLARRQLEAANYVHFHLYPILRPEEDVFATLLCSFALDPDPSMQSSLATIYSFSAHRSLYDRVIPALFENGSSTVARAWRRRFLDHKDFPCAASLRAKPFLRFMSLYFPTIKLWDEERRVLSASLPENRDAPNPPQGEHGSPTQKGFLNDATVARWFASSWASIEFTVNVLSRIGLEEVGPLALQSLVLREEDLSGVRERLAQLDGLGVQIDRKIYSHLIVSFVRTGDEESLQQLVHCDIHPDEFDDISRRSTLRTEAKRSGNTAMQDLFQKVERILQNDYFSNCNLVMSASSENTMGRQSTGILADVEPDSTHRDQVGGQEQLRQAFRGIDLRSVTAHWSPVWKIERAIESTRRLASQDTIVNLACWEILFNGLGHKGRFRELEQLCLEVVDSYHSRYGGIIPVHAVDRPCLQPNTHDAKQKSVVSTHLQPRERDMADTVYIPADLSFSHREHPIQKLFNSTLQRSIVRWGFDHPPITPGRAVVGSETRGATSYGVAQGVHLLARLRDEGVLIDRQILLSGLSARITTLRRRRGPRIRAQDSNETSVAALKQLVDSAWGSEILPPLPELLTDLNSRARQARRKKTLRTLAALKQTENLERSNI